MVEKEAKATESLLQSVFRLYKQEFSYKNKEICSVLVIVPSKG